MFGLNANYASPFIQTNVDGFRIIITDIAKNLWEKNIRIL